MAGPIYVSAHPTNSSPIHDFSVTVNFPGVGRLACDNLSITVQIPLVANEPKAAKEVRIKTAVEAVLERFQTDWQKNNITFR